ncbi:MAG: right-handed parallel beta-helix repeat-containing protein [Clostridiales bacterium]|nr:right-handed parallel beta-helix repeat-containing protein [Clostridiales bacterium]
MDFTDRISRFSGRPGYSLTGDIFVSPRGSDGGDGSIKAPFRTIARAQQAARRLASASGSAAVCVGAGVYRETPDFDASDSGCAYRPAGDGEVILDASEEIGADRFEKYRENILVCDLKSLGITAGDIGEIKYIGMFGTEARYDGYAPGDNVQLYMGGRRLELAAYPAKGFLKLKDVRDQGEPNEYPIHTYHPENAAKREPRAGEYVMDEETNARVAGWTHTDELWMYGYPAVDWADCSCPVKVDTSTSSIFPRCVSIYGAYPGGLYRFLNVLDELKCPGQYFIDRRELKLYLIPPEGCEGESVRLCLKERPAVVIDGANALSIEGFMLRHGRVDAISAKGTNLLFRDLVIHSFGGNAISVEGEGNTVSGCELCRLGKGGVKIKGGDPKRLVKANCTVENNLIHHNGEIYMVYTPGVSASGCGITVAHNEICFSPHTAVLYYGKYISVEYNHVHHVVSHASDAGAIYSGRDWTNVGCRVNYNYVHDIGDGEFAPDGIYFDDMLSGQECRGNIVVNVRKNGLLMGGGRDNVIENNIFAHCMNGIKFDDRARDAFVGNGWAKAVLYPNNQIWTRLKDIPVNEEPWSSLYPGMARLHGDLLRVDDPDFAPNPTGCRVVGNIIIGSALNQILTFESNRRYSDISGNFLYGSEEELKQLPKGFEKIPIDKIGRY